MAYYELKRYWRRYATRENMEKVAFVICCIIVILGW